MRWTVEENDPPLLGVGAVLLDGRHVEHVVAFDTEEGWVETYRVGEDGRLVLIEEDGEPVGVERERFTGKVEFHRRRREEGRA